MEARKKFYEWALNCSILTVSTIFITGLVEGTSSFLELYYPVCSVHSKLFHQTMNCFWHLNYWMRSLQRDFTIVLLSWVSYVDCWYDKNLFFTNGTFFEMDGSIGNTKARMSEPSCSVSIRKLELQGSIPEGSVYSQPSKEVFSRNSYSLTHLNKYIHMYLPLSKLK